MIINHNIGAMNAQRHLSLAKHSFQNSLNRLSSGERVYRAAEDPAGLAVSEKMRAQIRGLNQAERNIGDGISFLQTAESYMKDVGNILQRIRELAVQAANDTYEMQDRQQAQVEVNQLVDEIDRIASQAQFNGQMILDGSWENEGLSLQVGANVDQRETIQIKALNSQSLNLNINGEAAQQPLSFDTAEDATMLLTKIDQALQFVNEEMTNVGAFENRFTLTKNSVALSAENLQAAESRIRDADMAKEIVQMTRHNILQQAGVAMLAQANVAPQSVLRLLG